MEDAMIINKASLERGFAHGQIYKTEVRYLLVVDFCPSVFNIDTGSCTRELF